MRAAIALFITVVLAVVAYQLGAGLWPAAAVLGAGLSTLLIIFVDRDPVKLPARLTAPAPDVSEGDVIAAIAEPVLLVVDNRVRFANPAARALLGAHIVGEDIRLAIRHPAATDRLAVASPDGTVELVGIGARDQRFALTVSTVAPGRRLIHLTDRNASHAVEKARVDFVANASHELRTPLAAILGFIETLDDEKAGGDAEVRNRFLKVMFDEARRMQRLIDDLISLSRIEAEKYLLPGTTIVLASLIEEVAGEIRDASGTPRSLELDLGMGGEVVAGDRGQLSQLVHNLVGNAIKYGKQDGVVRIALAGDGQLIRMTISDDGEGIAPEHIPRLTERFYRVDASRSRAQGGTGLGLAIVKHIVERHRGRLEIASRVGAGTTVTVVLPAATAAAVMETSPN